MKSLSSFITILGLIIILGSLFLRDTSVECSFELVVPVDFIKDQRSLENFSLLVNAVTTESQGDYSTCKAKRDGPFIGVYWNNEALDQYNMALALYDSLNEENTKLNLRIKETETQLLSLNESLVQELTGTGGTGVKGAGPTFERMQRQLELYKKELEKLRVKYSAFNEFYIERLLSVKRKIADIR